MLYDNYGIYILAKKCSNYKDCGGKEMKSKRFISIAMCVLLVMQLVAVLPVFQLTASAATNNSIMLKTLRNKVVWQNDPNVEVRLVGVNTPCGEWTGTPGVEKLTRTAKEATENWNSNLLRLPVGVTGWFGEYSYQMDGGTAYRNYIDSVIAMASEAGKYVVLDLHQYGSFNNTKYITFWQQAAVRYKNNPTVLFGILNEPHDTTWDVWRNGNGSNITGHQQVVEMIRDLDAKNIIVAGGLDWAYDLTGISAGYALVDQGTNNNLDKAGNGIIYDTHIYPWKGRSANWDAKVGATRKNYPILVGETGWDPATNLSVGNKVYNPGDPMYHDVWVPELFAWMNDASTYGSMANWTAYSLHKSSAPKLIADPDDTFKNVDYSYPPTDYWGVYVKEELKQDRGTNLVTGKATTGSSPTAYLATDGDNKTMWTMPSTGGSRELTVDMGKRMNVNRWLVRNSSANELYGDNDATYVATKPLNTKDFKLQVSENNADWFDIDTVSGNDAGVTDRYIPATVARYLKLIVTKGETDPANTLRIYEFAAYGSDDVPAASFTVTFNKQDGSSNFQTIVNGGSKATEPVAPTRNSYVFGGWYTDANCTNPWNFDTDIVITNVTLYAKWTYIPVLYQITFDSKGGSLVPPQDVEQYHNAISPAMPTKISYEFGGWYKDAYCTNIWNFDSDTVTSNVTLYAKWTYAPTKYTVTFNSRNGVADTTMQVEENTLLNQPTDPICDGYIFGGWYKEISCANRWDFSTGNITANTTLYAKWSLATIPESQMLTVSSPTGKIGDVVSVDVTVQGNPGISAFILNVNFDKTKIKPLSITKGDILINGTFSSNIDAGNLDQMDSVTAVWAGTTDVTADSGTVFTIQFEVKQLLDNAQTPVTLSYNSADLLNASFDNVGFNVTDGSINIVAYEIGDIFSDGDINSKDVLKIVRYMVGSGMLTGNEKKAADVYPDGAVNSKDALRLAQYLAGWDVKLGVK